MLTGAPRCEYRAKQVGLDPVGWLGEERSTGATSSKEGRGQYKGSGNKQANKQAHGGHRRALERGGPAGRGCPVCQGRAAPPAPPRPTNSHSLLACAAAPRLCGARCRGGTALNQERKKPNTCRRHPYWAAACSRGGLLRGRRAAALLLPPAGQGQR